MFDDVGVLGILGELVALVGVPPRTTTGDSEDGGGPAGGGAALAAATSRIAHLSSDEVLRVVAGAARLASFAEAASLLGIGALVELSGRDGHVAGLPVHDSDELARSTAAGELALAARMAPRSAEARLDHAVHVLSHLPGTWTALAAGDLDSARAYRISDGTAGLSAEQARRVEDHVLRRAGDQTTTQLSRAVTRARLRVDPDPHRAEERVRARCAVSTRVHPDDPGVADLVLTGPSPLIAAAFARIDAAARDVVLAHRRANPSRSGRRAHAAAGGQTGADPHDPAGSCHGRRDTERAELIDPALDRDGDPLTLDRARLDVALEVLAGDADSVARVSGVDVEVSVVAAASTVLGLDDEPGELRGPVDLGPLPAAMVRQLAADARWRRWFTDESGTVTAVGRRTYRPPAALADLVRARDRTCRFPGCSRRAERCDVDHTVRFPEGDTSADNLSALCRRHHRLKHEAGWTVSRQDPGSDDLTWTSPLGQVAVTRAPRSAPDAQEADVRRPVGCSDRPEASTARSA